MDNKFELPKYYKYNPKQDITIFELAKIIPYIKEILETGKSYDIQNLDESFKRHFDEIEFTIVL